MPLGMGADRADSWPFPSVCSSPCASVFSKWGHLVPFFWLSALGLALPSSPLSLLVLAATVTGKLASRFVC